MPLSAASPEPMMAAAPVSAPMEEGNAWGDNIDTSILDMFAPYIMEDEAYAEAKSMTPDELASMAMGAAGIDSLDPQDLADQFLPPDLVDGLILDDIDSPKDLFDNASEWINMPGDMEFEDLTDPVYYQDQASAVIKDAVDIGKDW